MSDITIEAHRAAVEIQAHLRELNGHVPYCNYPGTDYLARVILAAFKKVQHTKLPTQTFLVVGSQRSYENWLARYMATTAFSARPIIGVIRITSIAEVDGWRPAENVFVVDCPDANLAALHELRRRGFYILPFE